MELAEDEMNNFAKVWATVLVSLSYCFVVGKLSPPGSTRFMAFLPIICLFLALPLNLTSFHLGGLTAFFIAWLANFKLLLFAFGKPPLCSHPSPLSFPHFLALATLPIKIQTTPNYSTNPHHKSSSSAWNYIIKAVLLILILGIYNYTDHLHPKVVWFIYSFHIYFGLELILAILGRSAKFFLGYELEPHFREPLLSSSLQDFWGKRWNITVTRILRPAVYLPTLDLSGRILGRRWAPLAAIMATFLVSAIMHELIFYYLGQLRPTFEVTCFFLLHGLCLCMEMMAKKAAEGMKWNVPRCVSGPLTLAFVFATGFWLFMPPLVRAGLDTRPFQEFAAVRAFATTIWRPLLSCSTSPLF